MMKRHGGDATGGQVAQLVSAEAFKMVYQLLTTLAASGTPQVAVQRLFSSATAQSLSTAQPIVPSFCKSCDRNVSYCFLPRSHVMESGAQEGQHAPGRTSSRKPGGHVIRGQLSVHSFF